MSKDSWEVFVTTTGLMISCLLFVFRLLCHLVISLFSFLNHTVTFILYHPVLDIPLICTSHTCMFTTLSDSSAHFSASEQEKEIFH